MMKKVIALSSIVFSINAYSHTDCPIAKITHIQVQQNVILINVEGQNWHRLGSVGGPGVSEMYSAVLSAHASDKRVLARYPDGYDCSAYNTNINAIAVRIYPN